MPFLIVLKISLSQTAIAQPPYVPVLDLAAGWQGLDDFLAALSLDNYALLGSDPLYLCSYLKSLRSRRLDARCCSLIGYPSPTASRARRGAGSRSLVMLVVLPFWTSFLIRIYAWINILQRDGLLNQALLRAAASIDAPLAWLATDTAVYIGIVYSYLPFMVLPI